MTTRRVRIALILVLAYALIMTFGGCASTLILRPPPGRIDPGSATRLMIPSDGREIEIWTARAPDHLNDEPKAFVLEFCGNATRAEQIAQYVAMRWRKYPVDAWVMNYPGYGGSDGPKKFSLIPPSALQSYDELARRANGRPIFLEANSLGTTAALYVAAHRSVAGIVLQNPPPLRRLILEHYGWWNLWLVAGPVALQIPSELNSLTNAPLVHVPAVFVTAKHDAVVPHKYSQMVYDAYAGEKRLIEMHGDHNSSVRGESQVQLDHAIDHLWSETFH